MRIIAGKWRGRIVEAPEGREVTRPTTDRVREACASAIEAALPDGIVGTRVLDAFAGSGSFGLEMLSRGAAHATFFEIDRRVAQVVRKNFAALKATPAEAQLVNADVLASAARGRVPGGPFTVVLIDPPYALGAAPAEELLADLATRDLLVPGAVALFERAASTPALRAEGFEPVREKRYGKTFVDILRYQPEGPDQAEAPEQREAWAAGAV